MSDSRILNELLDEICAVVGHIKEPLPDTAKDCHDAVQNMLEDCGLRTRREVQVNNGDGIVGRYDLVVYDEVNVAIEIDRRLVRSKSVQKLLGFKGGRIAILRGFPPPHNIPGIDRTLGLPIKGLNHV